MGAALVLLAIMTLLNQGPVLAAVRTLPEPLRIPLAGSLNLLAAGAAGVVLGWGRAGSTGMALGVACLWGWLWMQAHPALPAPQTVAWAGLLSASAVLGWRNAQPAVEAEAGQPTPLA